MHGVFSIFFTITLALYGNVAAQQNPVVADNIRDIFNTNPADPTLNAQQTTRGFGQIVTPVPLGTSDLPTDFTSISGKNSNCNCVPYYNCDPSTNTVTEDGTFDGFGVINIRFGDDDPICPSSVDVCCDGNRTRSVPLNPTPLNERPNRPRGCGIRNVGGIDFTLSGATHEAGFGEFPWTVALLYATNSTYFCSGSLIHPQVVLTAAHCIASLTADNFIIRAGEWDAQTSRERLPYQEQRVQRYITHPQYNPRSVANDFALVILTQPVTLADHINVVCLPSQNAAPTPQTTCISTGWGKDVFGAAGKFSVIMKRVLLPIVEYNECLQRLRATRLGPRFGLDRSFLCAGGQLGIDTCQGDGGAPLVCPIGIASENRYVQSGIVAWGIGCNEEIPAAYANVALVRNWIDSQMLANGFGTEIYSA